MRRPIALVAGSMFLATTTAGCASIIKGGDQSVTLRSDPAGARLVITDAYSGRQVHVGETPVTTSLKRGAGYFKAGKYRITVEKAGFKTEEVMLEGNVNGWYVGNVLFGGLIGLLIVDPLTGAMWTLSPEDANIVLKKEGTAARPGLHVVTLDAVPVEVVGNLKPVEPQS